MSRVPTGSPASEIAAWQAATILGALATAAGVLGLLWALAEGVGVTEAEQAGGARVLGLHHANPLGGLLLAAAGAVGLVGVVRRRWVATAAGGIGLLVLGLVSAVTHGLEMNVLGASAATLAVHLGLGMGLLACGLSARDASAR